jgi:hypothetical protein
VTKKSSHHANGPKLIRPQASSIRPKSLVTAALLIFVAVSVVAVVAKEFGNTSGAIGTAENSSISTVEDKVVVYYFHGNARCVTCRAIEAYTREAIEMEFAGELNRGSLEFHVINVETPSKVSFIDEYQLYSPSVVVVRFEQNERTDWKNLDRVWRLAGDKGKFLAYIQAETIGMMRGQP